MHEIPIPLGPTADCKSGWTSDPGRAELLADIGGRLREFRQLLDELQSPLAAAHIDMALHALSDAGVQCR